MGLAAAVCGARLVRGWSVPELSFPEFLGWFWGSLAMSAQVRDAAVRVVLVVAGVLRPDEAIEAVEVGEVGELVRASIILCWSSSAIFAACGL